jgi:hypothetical protein
LVVLDETPRGATLGIVRTTSGWSALRLVDSMSRRAAGLPKLSRGMLSRRDEGCPQRGHDIDAEA